MYGDNTPEGRRCGYCNGKGVYVIYKRETTTNYDGKKSIIDIYKCSHCGHEFRFIVYKDL